MLVQFTFNNFKCFADETALSLLTENTSRKGHRSIRTPHKYSVLKAVAVYGANGSGKTKLFDALKFMQCVICPPLRDGKTPISNYWLKEYDNFRLNTHFANKNSSFEVIFILNEIQYRYGFEVDSKHIVAEWLYAQKTKEESESRIIEREENNCVFDNQELINQAIATNLKNANMLSETTPFLSLLATFNDSTSKEIVNWFSSIAIISANDMNMAGTFRAMDQGTPVKEFMKAFDFNIEDIQLHEISADDLPEKIRKIIPHEPDEKFVDGVLAFHKVFNENYERIDTTAFRMEKDESFGTNRLFALVGPIFNALSKGTILLVDEIDSGLHTNIVRFIVSLFYRNGNHAQLIINSQNTSLLNAKDINDEYKLFNNDQLYVVNKNRYGEAKLDSLEEYSSRINAETSYIDGALGGVPNFNVARIEDIL